MSNETQTERDELVERVQQEVQSAFNVGRGFAMLPPPPGLEDGMAKEKAEEVIALVTAARDAEIREALLSTGSMEAAGNAIRELDWDVDEVGFLPTTEDVGRVSLAAALDHIGLGDSDTGGQG